MAVGEISPQGSAPWEMYVYRFFDSRDALLYVGITRHYEGRVAQHRRKPWFSQMRRVSFTRFASERAARDAETRAIRTESPIHNVAGREVA